MMDWLNLDRTLLPKNGIADAAAVAGFKYAFNLDKNILMILFLL